MSIEEQLKSGVSPVDLGNCTKYIKGFYNISEEESFVVLNQEKRDYNDKNITLEKSNDNQISLGKQSQVEIYDVSGRKLDLSVCKEGIKLLKYIGDVEEINVNSAKNYADSGIDIFNTSSDFFNNLCFQYDNKDGKDIIVNDRRTDIYKNVSFCQNGCIYKGMNYDLNVADCLCDSGSLQAEANLSDSEYNKTEPSQFKELVNSFLANLLDFNIDVLYCYNLVFNISKLKRNIGFFVMILMNTFQIFSLLIFFCKRLKPIKRFLMKHKPLSNPIKRKSKIKNTIDVYKIKKISNKNYRKINYKEKESSYKHLIISNDKENNESNFESMNKIGISSQKVNNHKLNIEINDRNSKNKKKYKLNKLFLKGRNFGSTEKLKEKKEKNKLKINIYNLKKKEFINNNKLKNSFILGERKIKNNSNSCKNCIKISQIDEDLQNMGFKNAVIKDKRSCLRIYWTYLVESQIILGTFFIQNYLDLFIIKFSFLICTFQISFFLNAFFYSDKYISDAYHNDGILDFITGLPKSIYSFIATSIITNILRILSNSKNDLLQIIRHRMNAKRYIFLINKKLKLLSFKLIAYFILVFLLGLSFLYYVSSFCAVYTHSQKYWFFGCLVSFAIDALFSFSVCILISTLKYISVHKQIRCLYSFVNFLSAII